MKNPLAYVFLRIAAFAIPLIALILLGANKYFSVAIAAAVGLTISIVWLSPSREELSKRLYEKYNSETKADKAEDVD